MEHKLKIHSEYLKNIKAKNKTSEVRLNDRDFQVGDIVYLFEYEKLRPTFNINNASYDCAYKISHIHSGLGMQDNYVVLSFKKLF
jgi:ASC-1-like (ASCH) protein